MNKCSLQFLEFDNPLGKALNLANYRDAPFSSLISLYILADVLQVHELKDHIITLIIDIYGYSLSDEDPPAEVENFRKVEWDGVTESTTLFWSLHQIPGLEDPSVGINMAFEKLPSTSSLCQLLIRCFCGNVVCVKKRTDQLQYTNTDFLAAIAETYASRWGGCVDVTDWGKEGEICKFHEHSPALKCSLRR